MRKLTRLIIAFAVDGCHGRLRRHLVHLARVPSSRDPHRCRQAGRTLPHARPRVREVPARAYWPARPRHRDRWHRGECRPLARRRRRTRPDPDGFVNTQRSCGHRAAIPRDTSLPRAQRQGNPIAERPGGPTGSAGSEGLEHAPDLSHGADSLRQVKNVRDAEEYFGALATDPGIDAALVTTGWMNPTVEKLLQQRRFGTDRHRRPGRVGDASPVVRRHHDPARSLPWQAAGAARTGANRGGDGAAGGSVGCIRSIGPRGAGGPLRDRNCGPHSRPCCRRRPPRTMMPPSCTPASRCTTTRLPG